MPMYVVYQASLNIWEQDLEALHVEWELYSAPLRQALVLLEVPSYGQAFMSVSNIKKYL